MRSSQRATPYATDGMVQWCHQRLTSFLATIEQIRGISSEIHHQAPDLRARRAESPRLGPRVSDRPYADAEGDLGRLDDLLANAVHEVQALSRHGTSWSAVPRASLAEACTIARRQNLHPEQVIVRLKRSWTSTADLEFSTREDAQFALEGIVTACIELYFDDCGERPTL
jgi:hypothetical protein